MQIETCVVKLGIPIGASDVTINITLGLLRFVARTKTGKNKQNYKKKETWNGEDQLENDPFNACYFFAALSLFF